MNILFAYVLWKLEHMCICDPRYCYTVLENAISAVVRVSCGSKGEDSTGHGPY